MELQLDRVTRRFKDKVAVEDFTASLTPGVHGLLGPNGAGKTTLIRLMADILSPTGGQILLDGSPIASLGENYRARLGYLPQHFGYYPGFTALDFLLYMAAVKGLPKPYAREQAKLLLQQVRLYEERGRKIKTFSGGMKQRLGIAQAMLGEPDILLLDEPTAGLDPKERIYFRNLIANYAQDKIVLLSTHIVGDVESTAGNVLVMKSGRLLHEGTPAGILRAIDGKVWECRISRAQADTLSLQYPVTSFRHENGDAYLRLVADTCPVKDAQPVTPGLEDLYLYYFAEEGAGDDSAGLRA